MTYQTIDSPPAAEAEVQVNENNAALGQAFLYSHNKPADSGLVVGINGGDFDANSVADTTVTCTNNTTNYIVAHRTTRAVSVSTGTTNWNDTATYGRVGRAVFASGVLTYHDERSSVGGIFDHAASISAVAASAVTVADAGNYYTGTNAETVLQEIGATLATLSGTTDVDTDEVYTSDTSSTADSDPGNGLFKWNNATQASATALYFDNQTAPGVSMVTFFASLPPDGYIHIAQNDDATKWQLWKWSGLPTAASGYYKFTGLTLMASGGSIATGKATSCSFKGTPPSTQPFDVMGFYPGIPTASAKVARVPIARAVTFAANFAGSYFTASANATATTVFDIQKNGASIGSVSIAAGGTTATFTTTSGTSKTFAAGDVLAIIAPGTPDTTLADPGFVLAGTR